MRHKIALALGLMALIFAFLPLPAMAQSLHEELRNLLLYNPQIQAQQKAVESARQGVRRAYAGYLPRVDAVGEYGPEYIDSPLTDQSPEGTWFEQREVAGVRMTQRVFDGFNTPSQVRTARLDLEVASYTLAGLQQNILFDGANAYIEVLRQQRLVRLAHDSETTIARQLHLEDERVERGAGIAVDVLQAKSRLQIAKERRVAYEGSLEDAISRYQRVFNQLPKTNLMLPPKAPTELIPGDLGEALRIADNENPALDASLGTVEVASERRRQARSEYYPTVNVVTSANREKNTDLVQGTRIDYSVILQVTWNLFNGFATAASVTQTAFDYRASLDNYELVRRQVTESTRLAWHEWLTAQQRVDLLNNAVAIASEVFDARSKLREAGRETVINVLDAENEVYNARINLTVAEADRDIAIYDVLRGIGRLDRQHLNLDE